MTGTETHQLEVLFDPPSIAVIGASPGMETMSGRLINYLDTHGYDGTIYPVNPSHDEVHARTCYESILDVPESPSHAYILIPAKLVETVVRECGEAGVEYVLVGSSGFSEAGHADREQSIGELVSEDDMRILGPNCEGVIDTGHNLALSFSSVCKLDLKAGGLGIVSQSGGLGGALLQMAQREHVGLSKWASTGNEADMSLLDVLEYYVESPDVDIAVAFIEGVGDGTRLRKIGRRALETNTPVLVIKAGDSDAGQEATSSHTGRISDTGEIYDAAFAETGITRITSIQKYLDSLESFTTIAADRYPEGRGIGVLSASGGACALIADTVERFDMELPTLPKETREKIAEKLPEYGSATNPVDVTGKVITDMDFFGQFIEDIARCKPVDAVLLQLGNTGPDYIRPMREDLYRIVAETNKPIVTSFAGGWPEEDLLVDLRDNGIPVYPDPEAAIRALDDMEQWRRRTRSPPEPLHQRPPGNTQLGNTWRDVVKHTEDAGIDVINNRTVSSTDAAVDAAATLGYPVTVKLDAPALSHKTEINGVRTDRRTEAEVRDAAADLLRMAEQRNITDAAVLVQEHIEGLEVVCGCFESDEFGPVMMFGAGGVFVEQFGEEGRDYVFLPASAGAIESVLSRGKLGDVLNNYRGESLARAELVETLANFGNLYVDSDVAELEANPIIVTGDRATTVDLVAK